MKIIIVRGELETSSRRINNHARILAEKGNLVSVLVWDRMCQLPKEEYNKDNYYIYRFRFKAPTGLKMLFYLPIWWFFLFSWFLRKDWDIVDAIDFHSIIPALVVAKIKRKPVIYEIADVYEDMLILPEAIRTIFIMVDKIFMRFSNAIIIDNEARIKEFNGIPNKNINIIYLNTPSDTYIKKDLLINSNLTNNAFTIFYAGAIFKNRKQNIDKVFHAVKNLNDVKLVVAGYGDQIEEIQALFSEKADKAQFLGRINYNEVIDRTTSADLLFALYDPVVPNTRYSILIKVLEAMMCGKPILVSKDTATADIVKKEKCGLIIEDPRNPEEIKNAILKLKNSPELCRQLGNNGRKAYEQFYSHDIMKERLLALYEKLNKQ